MRRGRKRAPARRSRRSAAREGRAPEAPATRSGRVAPDARGESGRRTDPPVGPDLLRADRAVTETKRTATDTSPADAGAGAGVQLRAVTFNMCGGMCNKGGTDELHHIERQISDFQPVHLIMLQEVCYPQFQWFRNKYEGTYEFGFTPLLTNYTGCGVSDCSVNMDSDPANDDTRCWIGQVVGARGTLGPRTRFSSAARPTRSRPTAARSSRRGRSTPSATTRPSSASPGR